LVDCPETISPEPLAEKYPGDPAAGFNPGVRARVQKEKFFNLSLLRTDTIN
jgi:hypothetical protein